MTIFVICVGSSLLSKATDVTKTKAHIQDEMNKKIKDIDHQIAIKMELQAHISARNIHYLCVIKKPKGSGYYSPKKCGISAIIPTKAVSMITGNISMFVSPGVSASSASGSSSTSLQAQIDMDEDFVADADIMAASVMAEAMPSTSAHDSTLAHVHNSDTKTDITEEQVSALMKLVSISELENVTGTSDGGDNDDEQVTHDQALGILEWEPVQEQQISINDEGGINVVNDDIQHANVDEEINVSSGWNKETCRRKANVSKVRRKIFDS